MPESHDTVGLEHFLADWNPPTHNVSDTLDPAAAARLAATLNLDVALTAGDPLPPLWQWIYFLDWPTSEALGADGHPKHGAFLPPIPNRRRMFAGGRIEVITPLQLGHSTQRTSRVVNTTVKKGRTGELMFVTVRHEYEQHGQLLLTEEQDLVYRSNSSAAASFPRADAIPADSVAPWQADVIVTPATLFRFSALTGNAHRIHYDRPYTTTIERFPDLVVHGPLLAVLMVELLRGNDPRQVSGLSFRLQRPVFLGDAVRVEGTPDGDRMELAVVSGAGAVHAAATVTMRRDL